MSSSEKRAYPRVEFEGRAWLEQRDLTLYLPIANVSEAGVFLLTGTPLSVGQRLTISLRVNDRTEDVVALIKVAWVGKGRRGAGAGCQVMRFEAGREAYLRSIARLAQ